MGRDAIPAGNATGAKAGNDAADSASGMAMTYPAKVTLDQSWIAVDGTRERLQPGMTVSAQIKTGDRRVLEYLLSPVMQSVDEAGRER